jgi:hypothetical protein
MSVKRIVASTRSVSSGRTPVRNSPILVDDYVAIADRWHVVISRQLHELGPRDTLGEITPLLDTSHTVTAPVHDQGGNMDRRQE